MSDSDRSNEAINEFWQRFIRYRMEDRGQSLISRLRQYNGKLISWGGDGPPRWLHLLETSNTLSASIEAFALTYQPSRHEFEARARSDSRITSEPADLGAGQQSPGLSDEAAVRILALEDALSDCLSSLLEEGLTRWLCASGFDPETSRAFH